MKSITRHRALLIAASGTISLFGSNRLNAADNSFNQYNLVSNIPGLANNTDSNLQNPWGLSSGPTTPFWAADNGAGVSTLYNGAGVPQPLVVTIQGIPAGTPTGTVFNGGSSFNGDRFLFATEEGKIEGWRGALGTSAEVLVDNSPTAYYKGLAIGNTGGNDYLYAANFKTGNIDVTPNSGAPALPGSFTDPNLPAGFAPFNIQNLNGKLYVTYAQTAGGFDDIPGPGHGFVDVFSLDGILQARLVSQGALNSPWGLTIAPAGFGSFGGDLLVGNFGDGTINAYDLATGAFQGTLDDKSGNPITIDGLWALRTGNQGPGFDPNSVYFTAGLNDEADGLFGALSAPDGGASTGLLLGGASFAMLALKRKK
jgi:uncharacterized protein (TIGR03118 family)